MMLERLLAHQEVDDLGGAGVAPGADREPAHKQVAHTELVQLGRRRTHGVEDWLGHRALAV
jgi:hypothetical protein